jgi:hypothetical protein
MSGRRQPQPPPPSPTSGWVILLSIVAIVASLGAVAFTVLRSGGAASSDSCRTLAWDALPNSSGLPDGWTVSAGNFYADGAGNTMAGPETADGSAPDTLYLQVTCYGADSHLAMTHSHQSALAAGGTDARSVPALGDESFATEDPTNGSTSIYVRRGGLVAVLIVPTSLDPGDLEQVARAVDNAMATAGSTAARPTNRPPPASPSGGVDLPTAEASASDEPLPTAMHGAIDLEAMLPKAVGGVALTRQSTTGTTALGSDPAIQAALTTFLGKLGKTPADLQSAEAYDETGVSDVAIFVYRVTGIAGQVLGQAIVDSDSVAAGSGVTSTKETVAGKAVTHIRYGDGTADDYVYVKGDVVFDVSTSDPATAIQALSALP